MLPGAIQARMLVHAVLMLLACTTTANAQREPENKGDRLSELIQDLKKEKIWRWQAANAIGEIGPRAAKAVPALLDAFDEEKDGNVRLLYVQALGKIGENAAAAVPKLMGALFNPKDGEPVPKVRQAIVRALLAIDETPKLRATVVKRALACKDPAIATLVMREFVVRENDALDCAGEIAAGMDHRNVEVRGATLECLLKLNVVARLPNDQKRIRAAIESALGDEDAAIRLAAVRGLIARRPTALPYRDRLAERLVSPKAGAREREALFRAIVEIDPELRQSTAAVESALKDAEPSIRAAAAKAIGNLGEQGKPFADALKALRDDGDEGVRTAVRDAAADIGAGLEIALPAELRTLFPPDIDVIAHLQFETLLDFLGARNPLLNQARQGLKQIAVLQRFSFDPLRDVTSATLAVRSLEPAQLQGVGGLLILSGTFANEAPEMVVEAQEDLIAAQKKIVEAPEQFGQTFYAVCLDKKWVLLSDSKETIAAAIKRAKEKQPGQLNPVLGKALATVDGRATLRLVSSLSPNFRNRLKLNDAPAGLTSVAIQVGFSEKSLALRAFFDTAGARATKAWKEYLDSLHNQLKAFLPLFATQAPHLKPLIEAVEKAQIVATKNRVRVTIELPVAALDEMFNLPKVADGK
jgi:HEAT repeat protein